jgi:hypothetical protein
MAQNDFRPITNEKYYCTGIMYWFLTVINKELCNKLYEFQINRILQGYLIPDEPVFNQYLKKANLLGDVKPLPKDYFLIGHRARSLLRPRNRVVKNASAFHANYLVGNFQKKVVLNSVASNRKNGIFWRFGLVLILLFKVKDRLVRNKLEKLEI